MKLIVNADDFGLSNSVNEAIVRAFDHGILTSCSLMVNEPACREAVELARARPRLAVGLHLVTVCGRAALPPAEIPLLVDRQGNFATDPFIAGVRYYFSAAARAQLEREIDAQFRRFIDTGLPFSHVDGHLHMHMHPTVFALTVAAAERYGVKKIRLPRERLFDNLAVSRARLGLKLVWWSVFQLLCRRGLRRLRGRGFFANDCVYGLLETGHMTEDFWLGLVPRLRAETNEIYCHPDTTPGSAGAAELAALLSTQVRTLLAERGIELVNYSAESGAN